MQTASEIRDAVKNIRYYTSRIKVLAGKQINLDFTQAHSLGINLNPGTTRFDCLGIIGATCNWLDTYCDNIESNLKIAIEQDKLLYVQEQGEGEGHESQANTRAD